jgi:hypothetical protein
MGLVSPWHEYMLPVDDRTAQHSEAQEHQVEIPLVQVAGQWKTTLATQQAKDPCCSLLTQALWQP